MASSRASSVTLAAESIDGEMPMDVDSVIDNEPIKVNELVLPRDLIYPGKETELSPSMKAASYADPRILKAVLNTGNDQYKTLSLDEIAERRENGYPIFSTDVDVSSEFGPCSTRVVNSMDVGITTPLMEAIRAYVPENVETLLKAGADPNGIPLYIMEEYAGLFLRFRPCIPIFEPERIGILDGATRDEMLRCMNLPQVSSLTSEEVEDRFWEGMAPFWCEQDFVEADCFPRGGSAHSLVDAAVVGSIDIFDQLLEAGADSSFWETPQFYVPSPPTHSSLSVSSPIHGAIQGKNIKMLRHILGLGFDPNTMPLVNPTRCITPLMATVVYHYDFQYEAFNHLASQRNINFDLRTPVYGVHLLHFAVATLDLDIIRHIVQYIPLRNAGVTALGHTLLHIACLPACGDEVQRCSRIIYRSIHETRYLHAYNDLTARPSPRFEENPPTPIPDHQRQTKMVKYLWENGITDLSKQDVHGNTVFHYLCGYKDVNLELLSWLSEKDGSQEIFRSVFNRASFTANELRLSGTMIKPDDETVWLDWYDQTWLEERRDKKERIWRGLLQKMRQEMWGT